MISPDGSPKKLNGKTEDKTNTNTGDNQQRTSFAVRFIWLLWCFMSWVSYEPRDFTKLDFDNRDEIKPLSKNEQKWVDRLQRVLEKCPTSRLALVTTGDSTLQVIDNHIAQKYKLELCDGYVELNGLELAVVTGRPYIYGVAG